MEGNFETFAVSNGTDSFHTVDRTYSPSASPSKGLHSKASLHIFVELAVEGVAPPLGGILNSRPCSNAKESITPSRKMIRIRPYTDTMNTLREAAATKLHLDQAGAITVRRRVPVRSPLDDNGEASATWVEYELIGTDELEDCDVRAWSARQPHCVYPMPCLPTATLLFVHCCRSL